MKRETSAGEPEPVEGTYTVPYLRMTLDGDHHLLPRYALHRDAVRAFLSGQLYEPHTHRLVTAFLRQHGGSMLHAGSFFGDMLPAFSRACEGMLHAFEPVLESYVLARTCVELNRLDNVLLFHAALAHQRGVASIATQDARGLHMGGSCTLLPAGTARQRVSCLTIDSLAIEDLSLLHLDVEGAQLPALQGAARTLESQQPAVLVEDTRRLCAGFLEEKGYACLGSIPNLHVWVHGSQPKRAELLRELMAEAGTGLRE